MINWDKTRGVFGDVDVRSFRPKVVVNCDRCKKESIIAIRVKSRVVNNDLDWLCQKCVGDDNSDILSEKTKESWKDDKYRKVITDNSKKLWKDNEYVKRHKLAVNEQESKKKCSDSAIKAWNDVHYREEHAKSLTKQLTTVPLTEVNVKKILDDLKIEYEHQFCVGPYTFDFMIKTNDKPLLLEIHGNYWHTRPYVIKKDKAKESYINGINKYNYKVLWESQLTDCNKVISLLKKWSGLSDTDRKLINLNDLLFSKVDRLVSQIFFGSYHYLGGAGRDGYVYGGFINDELICCAILAHPTRKESYERFNLKKNQCYELTRFAISPFYHNKNLGSFFLSKLINHIKNFNKDIKLLISFADPIENHIGTIYKASNWTLDGETVPSYFYMSKDGWKMHKKTLWNKANGMHLKEKDYAKLNGYEKINSPPLKRFIYLMDDPK